MKKPTIIFLSCLITVMLCIIAAEVVALYSGVNNPNIKLTRSESPAAAEQSAKPAENPVADPAKPAAAPAAPEAAKPVTEPAKPVAPAKKKAIELTVTNCATGKKNTLVQNPDTYALSLIDHNSKTLWTVTMKGPITEAVGEVDYFNNKKIQYLVAQGRELHLIDRLGREVKSFPRTLPSTITGGPTAVNLRNGGRCWSLETESGNIFYKLRTGEILKDLN